MLGQGQFAHIAYKQKKVLGNLYIYIFFWRFLNINDQKLVMTKTLHIEKIWKFVYSFVKNWNIIKNIIFGLKKNSYAIKSIDVCEENLKYWWCVLFVFVKTH